jgi:uncharacterized membrane protein YdjX (TVP38/TMEM64 family)
MSPASGFRTRRLVWLLIVIGIVGVVAAGGIAGWDTLRGIIDRLINFVRAAGPVPFFVAMALLPVPLAWFTIPAGEAFGDQLTLPGVIAASLAAMAVQVSLTYWLGRSAMGPRLQGWVARRGYTVPRVQGENALAVVFLVRLVPGPPLPLQCFLLGLAQVPFRIYFGASWLVTVPWVIGGVVFGRGLLQGNVMLAILGASVIGATIAAIHLIRRRFFPTRPAPGESSAVPPRRRGES